MVKAVWGYRTIEIAENIVRSEFTLGNLTTVV